MADEEQLTSDTIELHSMGKESIIAMPIPVSETASYYPPIRLSIERNLGAILLEGNKKHTVPEEDDERCRFCNGYVPYGDPWEKCCGCHRILGNCCIKRKFTARYEYQQAYCPTCVIIID